MKNRSKKKERKREWVAVCVCVYERECVGGGVWVIEFKIVYAVLREITYFPLYSLFLHRRKPIPSLFPWKISSCVSFFSSINSDIYYLVMLWHFHGVESLLFPPYTKCKKTVSFRQIFFKNCYFVGQTAAWMLSWRLKSKTRVNHYLPRYLHNHFLPYPLSLISHASYIVSIFTVTL